MDERIQAQLREWKEIQGWRERNQGIDPKTLKQKKSEKIEVR